VNSARNLQQLACIQSLTAYIELADARLAILEGRHAYALEKLEQLQGSGSFPRGHFRPYLVVVEQAFCLGQMGKPDEALAKFQDAQDDELDSVDEDDRLVSAWQLLALSRIDDRFGSVADRETEFASARAAYLDMTERVRSSFAAFVAA
jgi:hypothetical protein